MIHLSRSLPMIVLVKSWAPGKSCFDLTSLVFIHVKHVLSSTGRLHFPNIHFPANVTLV